MDILNKIPDNWVWTTLEEIADMTSGGTPSRAKKEYWNGNINWLKSGELKDTYIHEVEEKITEEGLKGSSAKIFPKDTLLMAMYGATVGRLGILNVDSSTNQAVCAIFNHHKLFVNEYLFFYLLSMRQKMLKDSFGGAQPNLSQGYIKSIGIPFAPLNEQKRIVAKIEKLFSNLDNSDKYLLHLEKQLKRYRKSVLKSAFETDCIIFKKLGDYVKITSGEAFKKSEYSNDGVRLFQIANVTFGKIIWDKTAYLPYEYLKNEKYEKLILKENDLVMALNRPMLNNRLKVGLLTANDVPSILYQRVGKFDVNREVNKEYLFYYLQSPSFLQWLSEELQGVNIPFINQSKMLNYDKFPLCSLENQEKITNKIKKHFSIIDKLETVVQQSIKESKRLRQSILKQAFEGKLVEQDLNDESASKLLEKIAKAKEEYQKAMKRKK